MGGQSVATAVMVGGKTALGPSRLEGGGGASPSHGVIVIEQQQP